jgi:hypothetical protein
LAHSAADLSWAMDMNRRFSLDEFAFRKILMRNVALPLGVGVVSVLVFAGLLSYLMTVIGWVDRPGDQQRQRSR